MSSVAGSAPWQVEPVGAPSRVAAAALVALSLDSVFLWSTMPHVLVSLVFAIVPLVIAIRVVRGFAAWSLIAALMCGSAGVAAGVELARANFPRSYPTAALVVAAALGVLGAVAAIAAWFERRRTSHGAVIELERSESLELSPVRNRRRS